RWGHRLGRAWRSRLIAAGYPIEWRPSRFGASGRRGTDLLLPGEASAWNLKVCRNRNGGDYQPASLHTRLLLLPRSVDRQISRLTPGSFALSDQPNTRAASPQLAQGTCRACVPRQANGRTLFRIRRLFIVVAARS